MKIELNKFYKYNNKVILIEKEGTRRLPGGVLDIPSWYVIDMADPDNTGWISKMLLASTAQPYDEQANEYSRKI